MRIATWNINSVRLRISLVRRFARRASPDVLCLQETKVEDDLFPTEACHAMGFPHLAYFGQKGYHGVAILSRLPIERYERHERGGNCEARHVSVVLVNGIEIHNLYVPAGGDEPDVKSSPKFAEKLKFFDEITAWFAERQEPKHGAVLAGDLNVAPLENDVWSHKQLLGLVSHTSIEVTKLATLQKSWRWVDSVRRFVAPDQKLYSWWSYRARDWAASDRGRRLDHIWVTPRLAPMLTSAKIERAARGWKRASDHVPVWVDCAL